VIEVIEAIEAIEVLSGGIFPQKERFVAFVRGM
jgi:hypothetical protein